MVIKCLLSAVAVGRIVVTLCRLASLERSVSHRPCMVAQYIELTMNAADGVAMLYRAE